eukprot:scaffold1383_cov360-Prasinococcus_capsulatus_cf.AAC.8
MLIAVAWRGSPPPRSFALDGWQSPYGVDGAHSPGRAQRREAEAPRHRLQDEAPRALPRSNGSMLPLLAI